MNNRDNYDANVDAGSIYIQGEVANQLLLAIGYTRSNDDTLSSLDRRRLEIAAQCLKAVFYGEEDDHD